MPHAASDAARKTTTRPSKAEPTGEVVAFQELYGVASRLGRPRERIVTWMARLQRGFTGHADASALADAVIAQDLRLTLFYFEGILKLYTRRYSPALDSAYAESKALEDALGHYGAAAGFTRLAREAGAPSASVTWCEQQERVTRRAVVELLDNNWLPDAQGRIPVFASLTETLVNLDFDGYRKDRKGLIQEIRRRLGKLEEASLDMYELQGDRGLHELRRQLRWLPIYCVALDGLVATSASHHPIKEYKALLTSSVASSPYAQLPPSTREDKPVEISLSLFLANTQLISELGELKDAGEEVEGLEHALLGGGAVETSAQAHASALALLGRTPAQQQAVHERAEKLYKGLKKHRFFKRLRADFKK